MTDSAKRRPLSSPTYDRPVAATLWVKLENGDEWEAGPEDLAKFDLGDRYDQYARACALLVEGLGLESGTDLTREGEGLEGANLVRYLLECALCYDHSPWANEHGEPWAEDEDADGFQTQLQAHLLGPARMDTLLRDVVLRLLAGWTPFIDRSGVARLGIWQRELRNEAGTVAVNDQDMSPAERNLVAELINEAQKP